MIRIETVFAGLAMDMIRSIRPHSNAFRSEAAASFGKPTYPSTDRPHIVRVADHTPGTMACQISG
jgi:hypothetical protein